MADPHMPDYEQPFKAADITFKELKIDAPPLRVTNHTWTFQDTDNAALIRFRERFRLDEVIAEAKNEWHAVRLLRNWVFMQNARGGNDVSTLLSGVDHEAMVLANNAGGYFWCTFFARLMVSTLSATGWVARKVAVGTDYDRWNEPGHHGVCEVWVNDLRKWVLLDAMHDKHFELDQGPMSGWELHRAGVEEHGEELTTCKGADDTNRVINGDVAANGQTYGDRCFWISYLLKNTSFSNSGTWDRSRQILLLDESHADKTWYQHNRKEHVGYKCAFIPVHDIHEVYFDVNSVYLETTDTDYGKDGCPKDIVVFGVGTFTPNLLKLEVSIDNGPWLPQFVHTRLQWHLHAGDNDLGVRAVNKSGHKGPVTRLTANGVKLGK
jgi:hypothetical protein